jgi:hypothetical protein
MKYRKLRIAWSVMWGVLCLLLIVLWMRSHFRSDHLIIPWQTTHIFSADSFRGKMFLSVYAGNTAYSWEVGKAIGDRVFPSGGVDYDSPVRAWTWVVMSGGIDAYILPHWFPVFIFATLAAAPWLPGRFSLRTLLIATTLVAIALGVIMFSIQ